MQDPFAIFTYFFASRATKAGAIILVLGWLPLLLTIAFGDPDANPIGLGLLAWLATVIAFLLCCAGMVRGFLRWRGR